jgi:hypothetical protein
VLTQKISFTDFNSGELNSLSWYDLLPGDRVEVNLEGNVGTAAEIAGDILFCLPVVDFYKWDLLASKLLNQCSSISGYRQWRELAYQLSEVMSENLTASGSRSVRMHAQRLIYYLQAIIDVNNPTESGYVVSEIILDTHKPWDYLRNGEVEWWLSSGENNLHCRDVNGKILSWRAGMPTQFDLLSDSVLAVGSIYTNGAILVRAAELYLLTHNCPVVLVFDFDEERFFLDHDSCLWKENNHEKILGAVRPQVHFARCFDGVIYLMDNSDFGHITTIDMKSLQVSRQPVLPVQVCNDLVIVNGIKYLIDKQQGCVFKFDENWKFKTKILKFGRGYGDLLDPVSIRCLDEKLYVVSWLTGCLTKLNLF